ncbi:hypothetical protein SAMN05421764_1432 [Donghicola eburneus]|nr:hypothetical protein SAMN05421764_1432 [Donghicola eburneus]
MLGVGDMYFRTRENTMPEGTAKFGFLTKPMSISTGEIHVEILDGASEIIQSIRNSERVHEGWYYAPPSGSRNMFNGEILEHPYPSRVFSLPFTHRLRHASGDDRAHLDFLIWCLGFFEGTRLTTLEAGYLDATPIVAGKLTDFILAGGTQPEDALELAERYWTDHVASPRQIKRMIGIIHCLFLAQNPKHMPFEKFSYLYTALDACYKATSEMCAAPNRLSHARRIEWTCQQFRMPVPEWANPSDSTTEISAVRNDAIHEALFFDEPLGFVTYGGSSGSGVEPNVPLQMEALTCRLIVALLGMPDAGYVRSPVNSRQRHGLCLR